MKKTKKLGLRAIAVPVCAAFFLGCIDNRDLGDNTAELAEPAYALAQGCYQISARDESGDRLYLHSTDTAYAFSSSAEQAAYFFAKPSALGEFLLYDQQRHYLSFDGQGLQAQSKPSDKSIWQINHLHSLTGRSISADELSLAHKSSEKILQQVESGAWLLSKKYSRYATDKLAVNFESMPSEVCSQVPEASLNASVSPAFYQAKDIAEPVYGFADLHTHIGFPKTMAGIAMAGDVFHPLGIEAALPDCEHLHGEEGASDFLEGQNAGDGGANAPQTHYTDGYPSFSYWPNNTTNTHVQAYYRWLERAHLSGLKLIVSHVTGNPSFCQILSTLHFGKAEGGCTGVQAVEQQVQYLYQMQDYIDAQAGGPGKGWFKIVTSPQQAREVIAANKLAVVLGVEHGDLFDCRESSEFCTPEYIDQQIDAVYQLGVRSVFPIHRFDNAFGGTKPGGDVSGAWMHIASRISTSSIDHVLVDVLGNKFPEQIDGHFWHLDQCPEGVAGTANIADMQQFLDRQFGVVKDAIPLGLGSLVDEKFIDKLGDIPQYPDFQAGGDNACNTRGLQPQGEYLVNRLIDKGMLVEVDHLSYPTFDRILSILEQRNYPGFLSGHSWFEDNAEVRQRILSLGGLIAPMKSNPSNSAAKIAQLRGELAALGRPLGVAISTDIQGVTGQANADADVQIDYPFSSISGEVSFEQPQTGDRVFDYAQQGVAHYGLLAEWSENLRQVAAQNPEQKILESYMSSVEAYLQMWQAAEQHQLQAVVLAP